MNFQSIVRWYSITTYRNTYKFPMDPIRLEDFRDIQLYITDDTYRSDGVFAEQVKLVATAPNLSQLRGRPKKRRIRKATEGKPKRQLKCGHCKQVGHNRRACRNGRKEPEVVLLNSSTDEEIASTKSTNKANEVNQVEVSSNSEVDELA
jgi:hypothetical protein